MSRLCILLFFALFFSTRLSAIILQHDIPPQRFVEFAKHPMFESVGKIHFPTGSCTGFLTGYQVVTTAGHCVEEFYKSASKGDSYFILDLDGEQHRFKIVGGRELDIPFDPELGTVFAEKAWKDLGVLYLDYPMRSMNFLPIIDETLLMRNVQGLKAYVAGYGANGFADQPQLYNNTQKFAGELVLSQQEVVWDEVGLFYKTQLRSEFLHRSPERLSIKPSFGDSGAPLIAFDDKGQAYVLGLVAASLDFNDPEKRNSYRAIMCQYMKDRNLMRLDSYDLSYFGSPKSTQSLDCYLSVEYFTYLGAFNSFLEESKSRKKITSEDPVKRWSEFSARLAELGVSQLMTNTPQRDKNGVPIDYEVLIKNFVIADQSVQINALSLEQLTSKLLILKATFLSSLRVKLEEGSMNVEGFLESEAFTIGRGELKGNGYIQMKRSEHDTLIRREGYYSGQILFNREGLVNLSEKLGALKVLGNYIHDPKAKMSARIEKNHGSSLLAVSDKVKLRGGTLEIHLEGFENQNREDSRRGFQYFNPGLGLGGLSSQFAFGIERFHMQPPSFSFEAPKTEERWTVLQAAFIEGHFQYFYVDPRKVPPGYEIFVEYFPTAVQVVLRKL